MLKVGLLALGKLALRCDAAEELLHHLRHGESGIVLLILYLPPDVFGNLLHAVDVAVDLIFDKGLAVDGEMGRAFLPGAKMHQGEEEMFGGEELMAHAVGQGACGLDA